MSWTPDTIMRSALIGLALLASASACGRRSCRDAGRTHEDEESWTCSDGCNSCSCEDGEITSTLVSCPKPPGPAANKRNCRAELGSVVTHGTVWGCDDGACCTCNDGEVRRTTESCSES